MGTDWNMPCDHGPLLSDWEDSHHGKPAKKKKPRGKYGYEYRWLRHENVHGMDGLFKWDQWQKGWRWYETPAQRDKAVEQMRKNGNHGSKRRSLEYRPYDRA